MPLSFAHYHSHCLHVNVRRFPSSPVVVVDPLHGPPAGVGSHSRVARQIRALVLRVNELTHTHVHEQATARTRLMANACTGKKLFEDNGKRNSNFCCSKSEFKMCPCFFFKYSFLISHFSIEPYSNNKKMHHATPSSQCAASATQQLQASLVSP